MRIAVIGSGPSGWVVVKKLIERGFHVTLIDTGIDETDSFLKILSSRKRSHDKKLVFGSDLPYRQFPIGPTILRKNTTISSTYCRGGFSRVWGATMLPYSENDLTTWPIEIADLNIYYRNICEWIPIAGKRDSLSSVYGDFFSRAPILQSQSVVRILEELDNSSQNYTFGSSRLAVETGTDTESGCYYCNKCLDGCPSSFIWSAETKNLNVTNLKFRVISLKEVGEKVFVHGIKIDGSLVNNLDFDKVFLAAGAIESFRILATSKMVSQKVDLQDSAIFYTPIFLTKKFVNLNANAFGLTQMFIRLEFKKLNHPTVYQLYDFSEHLLSRAQSSKAFAKIIPRELLKLLLKRMVVGVGYLNSLDSPTIDMELLPSGSVQLNAPRTGKRIRARNKGVFKSNMFLLKVLSSIRILPITFSVKISAQGEGYHFGAWLPMGEKSDLLGRPNGYLNVHVVDSSVLPNIPSGPITFTIMANALRIIDETFI